MSLKDYSDAVSSINNEIEEIEDLKTKQFNLLIILSLKYKKGAVKKPNY